MLRRGNRADGEERDYLELSVRRPATGSSSRSSRSAGSSRYSGARAPAALEARRHRVAADEAARPQGRRRTSPRSCSRCTPRAPTRQGHAFAPDTPVAGRDGGERSRTRRRPTSSAPSSRSSTTWRPVRPMDRLVVGDVGYGKTEVALRAAFKAIQDGKQVAVLVPTTVLAAQHHATFGQRFAAFPVKVAAAVAVRRRRPSRRRTIAGLDGRLGRPRDRDAPAAVEGRPVPRPRPRRRRRGAAVRRRGEGAPQAAPARGRRPDAVAPRRSRGRSTWPSPASAT